MKGFYKYGMLSIFAENLRDKDKMTINYLSRGCAALLGMLWCWIEPTLPFALFCIFAVLLDCLSAWRLDRRVKDAFPNGGADGKFKSQHASKMIGDLFMVWLCILLAGGVDQVILPHIELYLGNYVAAIFCLVEFWSVLENESSCNGASWAKVFQTFLVDKTTRHLDVDIKHHKKRHETIG